jgi:protease IV
MKKLFFMVMITLAVSTVSAQVSSLYSRYDLLQAPSSTFSDGLLGFVNPANVGLLNSFETQFRWTTEANQFWSMKDWGGFAAVPGLGFGLYRQKIGGFTTTNYQASFGFGSDQFALGAAYNWAKSDELTAARQTEFKLGMIWRPAKSLSFGMTGFFPGNDALMSGLFEAGFRPFNSSLLTLFGDAVLTENQRWSRSDWSAGVALRALPGVYVVGRWFGDESFTAGINLDFGKSSLAGQGHYDSNHSAVLNSYMIRAGGLRNSLEKKFSKNTAYVPFAPKGVIDYQKYTFFEGNDARFYDLLRDVRAAANDPRISIIAFNLTAMQIRPEHAWELREELANARRLNKQVIVFIENAGMTGYHLASVADEVIIDPQGMLFLPGLVMSRTYMKGTLEKLGLGFDEWRFFKYKSAYETFSREGFSEGEAEQRTAYLDDWYSLIQKDVCASRGLTSAAWDSVLNNHVLYSAETARRDGLVDRLGRWSDLQDIIKEIKNQKLVKFGRNDLWDNAAIDEQWGGKPKIALVYAIGECDMESGIKARRLQKYFEQLANQSSVKAVVFRVDSPGGSGMASDVVADALKKCAEKKPVIISQGQVAGSGGYWISMYGKKIIAGPNTVTGSIGVIGGWIWDKGLSEKLGITEDNIKRGDHADISSGVTLPLLGLTVPRRNLTLEERAQVEAWIKEMYNSFVDKVAVGRSMTKEAVQEAAQGHYYSGLDGKTVGLVDEIGGLMTALAVAKQEANIGQDQKYELIEMPKSMSLSDFLGGMTRAKVTVSDPAVDYLRKLAEEPLRPLFLMSPDDYPSFEK